MPAAPGYQRILLEAVAGSRSAGPAAGLPSLGSLAIPADGSPVRLATPAQSPSGAGFASAHLRITSAADHRDCMQVAVRLAETGQTVGILDLRYAVPLQVFQLEISSARLGEVLRQGLVLSQTGGREAFAFISGNPSRQADGEAFLPHVLLGGRRVDAAAAVLDALGSPRTLAPFGWEEGCLSDALWQLGLARPGCLDAPAALRARFAAFGALAHSWPAGDYLHSIESTLPFAVLARLDPGHPALAEVLAFWESRRRSGGVIADFSTTAEGAYTVAYPMAVIAALSGRRDLSEGALEQVRLRVTALADGNDLYLRRNPETGGRSYRNWARAYAWYMLGILRTISAITHDLDTGDLRMELHRVAAIALGHQRADGLWCCYLDDPDTLPDTAGSAGIAAAIAGGIRAGLLPAALGTTLPAAWESLLARTTIDGLLTGVAQSNKGGEALQRSDYRVILAMGLGLLGQFLAHR